MSQWGIDEDGISTPSYSEILDYYAKRWEEEFGTQADLSNRSPEGQFLRVIAESVANKGLPWSDITSLWDAIESVYNSGFISTASGSSLDHIVDLRGVNRGGAHPATGTLVFSGDKGEKISRGTKANTSSGIEFETTRQGVINRYGVTPVPAESVQTGEEGNVIAGTITESEQGSVGNRQDSHKFHMGSIIDTWTDIPNDETATKYQRLSVNTLKYATNVDTIEVHVKSKQSGLYALYLSILDFQTGEELYRTETQEHQLAKDSQWNVKFEGEQFDLLKENIDNDVRIVPINLTYSKDNLEIGLEQRSEASDWYVGTAAQPRSLVGSITTKVDGAFTGGQDRETDLELKSRYMNSLSKGGTTRPLAIESELYNIDTIKHVQVLENNEGRDYRPSGLPPHSIEVIVWGGSNEDILQALLNSRPAGVNTYGDNVGVIKGEFGQTHQFRYTRATETEIYIDINIVVGKTFPATGGDRIRNICAEIVGGEDLNGTHHAGTIGLGDTLYQSELESTLHTKLTGLKSVKTQLGLEKEAVTDQDLKMGKKATPIVKPDNIYISKGA